MAEDIREFTCKVCHHRVVVNPNLPDDYEPDICTPCADLERDKFNEKLAPLMIKFLSLLDAKQEPLGPEFERVLHDNLWDLYAK